MFIKFGSEENITDLFENGTIYFNSREFFRRIEDKEVRGDSYEAVHEIKNYGPGSFLIPSSKHSVHYQNIHLPFSFNEVWGNLYCVYCISPETVPEMFDFQIDERVLGFGTHCLLIEDHNKFIAVVANKLNSLGYKFSVNIVKYYDKQKFNGKPTVFEKLNVFAYQKEFRFYLEREGIDPISFHIDGIKEYSRIITSEQILTMTVSPGE
jgi:hypothetical protein